MSSFIGPIRDSVRNAVLTSGEMGALLKPHVLNPCLKVFRLAVTCFLFAAMLQSFNNMFGDPIYCACGNQENAKIDCKVVQSFCWMKGLHTLVDSGLTEDKYHIGVQAPSPNLEGEEEITYLRYYQWVPFLLAGVALLLHLPGYIWKRCEGNEVFRHMLVANFITKDSKIGDPTDESIRNIAKILINNRGLNFMYGVKYVLCNILALVSVVLSAHLIQVVLNHHFLSYGLAFIGYQPMTIPEKNITIGDPLEFVFPKLAKCTFRYFASGGGGQTIDSLCTLPVNILNEKIFVAAWFLLLLLFIWSLINVLLVLLAAASSHYRFLVTKYTLSSRTLDDRTLSNVLEGTTFSDWVLLTRFTDNLHRSAYINVFRALLRELPGQQHVQELRSLDLTRKNNQFSNHHNHSGSPNGGPRQSQTEVFFAHL